MKKFVILFCLLFFTPKIFAEKYLNMAISFSPLSLIGGGLSFMYQLKMTDFLSLTLPCDFYYSFLKSSIIRRLSDGENIKEIKSPLSTSIGLGGRFLLKN